MNAEHFINYLNNHQTIPGREIEAAMRSDDLAVLGVLWELASSHADRIDPPVDMLGCNQAIAGYFLQCIEHDPQLQDFVLSRYEAARELLPFFRYWKEQGRAHQRLIPETLEKLRQLYLRSDAETRLCIETGFLEHFLEDRANLTYLQRWQDDPITAQGITDTLHGWYGAD